tara:strand:+ start:379 stop:564 length:186 start_codon:yes stop_codon:yes gene_type:complete
MPDVTVTFTDAQWTRIVAATSFIIREDEGVVDATKLAAKWKELETSNVKAYEQAQASVDEF